jgi:signal transduction histidine kinase
LEVPENVEVLKNLDLDMIETPADGVHLERVFLNLAKNSLEAMPEGGELTITTRRCDGYAEVSFADTGVGIPEENLKKIFDPLFTTKTKGTGLGLAICQEIVSKHKGTIDVKSRPGKGSTFAVKLPLGIDDHKAVLA